MPQEAAEMIRSVLERCRNQRPRPRLVNPTMNGDCNMPAPVLRIKKGKSGQVDSMRFRQKAYAKASLSSSLSEGTMTPIAMRVVQ